MAPSWDHPYFFHDKCLFSSSNGSFTELNQQFFEVESSLTSAEASSFVALNYLSFSILLENCDFSIDLVNDFIPGNFCSFSKIQCSICCFNPTSI